jgi:hypothetical protein
MTINFANNSSLANITALPASISGGALNLISTQTASASATIDFTSGIDSTYDSYVFKFYDIHPATDGAAFSFQADTGTNTSYNQTITSTFFRSILSEADDAPNLAYVTGNDLAQSTSFQMLANGTGNDNDQCLAGTLTIFSPASATFVKHFIATANELIASDQSYNLFCAGYFNTTTALTRVRFKFSSGNIDDGIIKMYGVS